MQAKSALFNSIESGAHHVEYKLTIGGTQIPASYIQSMSLEGSLFEDYSFGHCNLRSANLTVDGNYHAGDELVVYARIANATQQSEWIKFCTLIIFSRELVDESYSVITAYDILGKTEYQFKNVEVWQNMTFAAAVTQICTDIGATLASGAAAKIPNGTISSDPQSMTAREILQHIAAAAGANWCTNTNGEIDLVYVTVPTSTYAITEANTVLNTYHQKQTYSAFVGVEIEGESLIYRSPSGLTEAEWQALKKTGRVMDGVCYWIDQDMADDILAMLENAPQFSPWSADINADICAELGDGISIGSITSIYGRYALDASGGRLFGQIGANGISNIEYLQQYVPAIERKLIYQGQYTRSSITVLDDRITSSVEEIDGDIVTLQTQITQNVEGIEAVTQRIDESESYLRWDGTTATLSIGESTSPTEAQVSPSGFSVVQNGETILTAQNQKVSTTRLEATETLTVGRYQWLDEQSKGYSLIYLQEQ